MSGHYETVDSPAKKQAKSEIKTSLSDELSNLAGNVAVIQRHIQELTYLLAGTSRAPTLTDSYRQTLELVNSANSRVRSALASADGLEETEEVWVEDSNNDND